MTASFVTEQVTVPSCLVTGEYSHVYLCRVALSENLHRGVAPRLLSPIGNKPNILSAALEDFQQFVLPESWSKTLSQKVEFV